MKQAARIETDRPIALREAMMAVRNGGVLSVVGVYGGFLDKLPFGSVMNRGVTIKTAQTPVQKYMPNLLERVEQGDIDPSFVITHHLALDDAPEGYAMFKHKVDGCIKIVLKP